MRAAGFSCDQTLTEPALTPNSSNIEVDETLSHVTSDAADTWYPNAHFSLHLTFDTFQVTTGNQDD